jgi:hypothetical protein
MAKPKLDLNDLLGEIAIADLANAPDTEQSSLRPWYTPSGTLARLLVRSARKAMRRKTRSALLYAAIYGIVESFGIIAPLKLMVHLTIEEKRKGNHNGKSKVPGV